MAQLGIVGIAGLVLIVGFVAFRRHRSGTWSVDIKIKRERDDRG